MEKELKEFFTVFADFINLINEYELLTIKEGFELFQRELSYRMYDLNWNNGDWRFRTRKPYSVIDALIMIAKRRNDEYAMKIIEKIKYIFRSCYKEELIFRNVFSFVMTHDLEQKIGNYLCQEIELNYRNLLKTETEITNAYIIFGL